MILNETTIYTLLLIAVAFLFYQTISGNLFAQQDQLAANQTANSQKQTTGFGFMRNYGQ